MKKYEAVVLAFRRAGAISTDRQMNFSAVVTIHGKPMIEWIIDALRGCSRIGRITVVGPDILDNLFCMRFIDRRITPLSAAIDDWAAQAVRDSNHSRSEGFLIVPVEAVLLTSLLVDRLCVKYEHDKADIIIPAIPPEKIKHCGKAESPLRVGSKNLNGGFLAIAKNSNFIVTALAKLNDLHKTKELFRDSGSAAQIITAENKTVTQETRVRFVEMNDPGYALYINSKSDLEVVEKILPRPFKPPFSRVKVILNPSLGKGIQIPNWIKSIIGIISRPLEFHESAVQYELKINHYLTELGIKAEFVHTSSAKEATSIAHSCAEDGYDCVIAVGGDGTINSVINGLAGTNTALAVIPLGTVNVLALDLDIPMDIRPACQLIARGRIKTIDLGRIDGRYFSCICGIGFDAYVIQSANTRLKKSFGACAYIITALRHIIKYRFRAIKFSIDDQPIHFGYAVIIGNGKYYSANMYISPTANDDDGLLDILVFKNRDIFSLVRYLGSIMKGDIISRPGIEHFKAKKIYVEKQGRHPIHIDGEYYGRSPIEINIAPLSLKVVC